MEHAAVEAARRVGEQLRPRAERADVDGVQRSDLDALAAAGLMDVSSLPWSVQRAVTEELAGADASTWFVWTQHHTPVRTVARSTSAPMQEVLPPLRSGHVVAGVAFTHLRRPGPPAVSVRDDGGTWVLDGDIAWLTSWGLADVFLVGAQHDDDIVWLLLPLQQLDGVEVRPLQLAAMQGTATVGVRLQGVQCSADAVVLTEPLNEWRALDANRAVDVSAAVLGVTAEAARRLRERRGAGSELADRIDERLDQIRRSAYPLAEEADPTALDERLRWRAEAHAVALDATSALVAAGGGGSMLLDQAAQRLARTALFLQVQGQTADVRAAQLAAVSARLSGT